MAGRKKPHRSVVEFLARLAADKRKFRPGKRWKSLMGPRRRGPAMSATEWALTVTGQPSIIQARNALAAEKSSHARTRRALRFAKNTIQILDASVVMYCGCGCGGALTDCALKQIAKIRRGRGK